MPFNSRVSCASSIVSAPLRSRAVHPHRRQMRGFSHSRSVRQAEHKTYFQPGQQRSPARLGRGNGLAAEEYGMYDAVAVAPKKSSIPAFLIGFLTFPLIGGAGFYAAMNGWIPGLSVEVVDDPNAARQAQNEQRQAVATASPSGESADESEMALSGSGHHPTMSPEMHVLVLEKQLLEERLKHMTESAAKAEDVSTSNSLLDSSNESQLKVHKLLLDVLTNAKSDSVVLDNAMLESRPIVLPDNSRLPTSNAALIRVTDRKGKNKAIILGVDMDYHQLQDSVRARFPSDCYYLDEWLSSLADDMAKSDEIAEDGLSMYLYSNRVILDVKHETGHCWMTRYHQSDFPPGFPLKQMRQIQKVQQPDGNLSNVMKLEPAKQVDPSQEAP